MSPPMNTFGADTGEDVTDWGQENIEQAAREAFSGPVYIDPGFAARVAKRVAELSGRSSPDDWPEAMLVTADELIFIISSELRETPPDGVPL